MSPSEQPEIPEELLKGVLSGGSAVHFVSWDRYTTLGAGSAPFLLVEPVNMRDALNAVRTAYSLKKTVFPLGKGTNIVGSDVPVPDLVFLKLPVVSEFGQAGTPARRSDSRRCRMFPA